MRDLHVETIQGLADPRGLMTCHHDGARSTGGKRAFDRLADQWLAGKMRHQFVRPAHTA